MALQLHLPVQVPVSSCQLVTRTVLQCTKIVTATGFQLPVLLRQPQLWLAHLLAISRGLETSTGVQSPTQLPALMFCHWVLAHPH